VHTVLIWKERIHELLQYVINVYLCFFVKSFVRLTPFFFIFSSFSPSVFLFGFRILAQAKFASLIIMINNVFLFILNLKKLEPHMIMDVV